MRTLFFLLFLFSCSFSYIQAQKPTFLGQRWLFNLDGVLEQQRVPEYELGTSDFWSEDNYSYASNSEGIRYWLPAASLQASYLLSGSWSFDLRYTYQRDKQLYVHQGQSFLHYGQEYRVQDQGLNLGFSCYITRDLFAPLGFYFKMGLSIGRRSWTADGRPEHQYLYELSELQSMQHNWIDAYLGAGWRFYLSEQLSGHIAMETSPIAWATPASNFYDYSPRRYFDNLGNLSSTMDRWTSFSQFTARQARVLRIQVGLGFAL